MKITKERLKQIIKEEMEQITEDDTSIDELESQMHLMVDRLKETYRINGDFLATWLSRKVDSSDPFFLHDVQNLQSILSILEQIIKLNSSKSNDL